jgi:hypothetical protein
VSSVRQYEATWDYSSKMGDVLIQAIPGVAGVAAGTIHPLLTPAVTSALNTILQTQPKQLEQLEQIGAAIEAQIEAPYIEGLNSLSDAKRATEATRRQERIEKAIDRFESARALAQARVKKARGEQYLFHQATAEYQMGNCWTLLGHRDEARAVPARVFVSDQLYV